MDIRIEINKVLQKYTILRKKEVSSNGLVPEARYYSLLRIPIVICILINSHIV